MAGVNDPIRIYQDLAERYAARQEPQLRDRYLVLAADAARAGGQADAAERLREQLLKANPHHLLKPFGSFAEAMRSPDVENYVAALRRTHPAEAAAQLLTTLGAPPAPPPKSALPEPAMRLKEDAAPEPSIYKVKTAPPPPPPPTAERPAPPRQPVPLPPIVPAASKREVYAIRPDPDPARRLRSEVMPPEDLDEPAGGWVASLLFVLLLAFGVLLLAYTLAQPFLPFHWLPHPVPRAAQVAGSGLHLPG